VPVGKRRALIILTEYEAAVSELVGRTVILTDGTAGTVENVSLDEFHGLRISIEGHIGTRPISMIKFA
jgi:hypothetical protein